LKKTLFIIFIYTFVSAETTISQVESLYYDNQIVKAKSLLETITDKDESYYYLAYLIYYKLDDLNGANTNLQHALQINEDKYFDEGDQLGQLINDLKNANKTLTSGFVAEAIEESKKLVERYKFNAICYYGIAVFGSRGKNQKPQDRID